MLAPGFWRVRLARENRFLATHFARRGYDVAVLDFRGHGESGGAYSFGVTEHHDFQAVLDEDGLESVTATQPPSQCSTATFDRS